MRHCCDSQPANGCSDDVLELEDGKLKKQEGKIVWISYKCTGDMSQERSLKPSLFSLFYLVWQQVAHSSFSRKTRNGYRCKETILSRLILRFRCNLTVERNQRRTALRGGNLKGKRYSSDWEEIEAFKGSEANGSRSDLVDQKVDSSKRSSSWRYARQQRFGKAAQGDGINDSSMDERFAAQTFTLTEGRHIRMTIQNVALVHEDFARKII